MIDPLDPRERMRGWMRGLGLNPIVFEAALAAERREATERAAPRAEAEALLDRIMDEWDRDEAIAGLAAALAAPRAEGLGVERLRWYEMRLTEALNTEPFDTGRLWTIRGDMRRDLARLSRPSDERVPGEEPR